MLNRIRIFLASSAELKKDRLALENFIARENKNLVQEATFIHLDIWEDFIDAVSQTRFQDKYNEKIKTADIFIMLFFTKVGMYTSEEFDIALEQFKKVNKPFIYTYFKNAHLKFKSLKREEANSVWDFQEKLQKLGHFYTVYENDSELKLHFSEQLRKLFTEGLLKKGTLNRSFDQISKCLLAEQPSVPTNFCGRETDLLHIKLALKEKHLLLVNGEGGIGKTSVAAKYLSDNLHEYKHFAWLFCDNGIIEKMKLLSEQLHVDLHNYFSEEDQLLALKTSMENLGTDCLLILDNVSEPGHIKAFQKYFGGLNWEVLITSRCQQIIPENEYPLLHLSNDEAKILFKKNHDETSAVFEDLLDRFLIAIGYNTLLIELFSKNLNANTAIGQTLEDALLYLEELGLFLGAESFELRIQYPSNIHKEGATLNQILDCLYDLSKLDEINTKLLVNLALIAGENHPTGLLFEFIGANDKFIFAKQLKNLVSKGWLNTNGTHYRMSPVLQRIILEKNRTTLYEDAIISVNNLIYKLDNNGESLLSNLKDHNEAKPFALLSESVLKFLKQKTMETGFLSLYLSDYLRDVGNFKTSFLFLDKASQIFKEIDINKYCLCIARLGKMYIQQGEYVKALPFLEERMLLSQQIFDANTEDKYAKHQLAIAYSRLGDWYYKQSQFRKALEYYEIRLKLGKELLAADPKSNFYEFGLAVTYERIGLIYWYNRDYKKALECYEPQFELCQKLVDEEPQNESFKQQLSIAYLRLANLYLSQLQFRNLLTFSTYR